MKKSFEKLFDGRSRRAERVSVSGLIGRTAET